MTVTVTVEVTVSVSVRVRARVRVRANGRVRGAGECCACSLPRVGVDARLHALDSLPLTRRWAAAVLRGTQGAAPLGSE